MSSIGHGLKTAGKWVGEPWEVIAGVAVAAAGVGLMSSGVGGPAGVALMALSGGMLSGGASMVSQELTEGKTDWSMVGKDALVGALPGSVTAYNPKGLNVITMKTFKYGLYRSGYNHRPEVLNRVGNEKYKFGEFWSHDVPKNLEQARNDKALPLHWSDKDFADGYNPAYPPPNFVYDALSSGV